MAKMYTISLKFFFFIFFITKITPSHINASNFEDIKNDFFLKSEFHVQNNRSAFISQYSEQNEVECMMEMNALKTGFKNNELWAKKGNQFNY